MAQAPIIPVRGLYTSPNEHGEVPRGALTRAENRVLSREGVSETRRGQKPILTPGATSIFQHAGRLFLHDGATLARTDAGVTVRTAYANDYRAPSGARMRAVTANKNCYFTTDLGVKRMDDPEAEPVDAGVPPALDVQATLTGASGFLPAGSAVAYRAVWGLRDANGNLILSAPSGRTVVVNGGATSSDVAIQVSKPAGLSPSHFLQLYRTAPSAGAAIDPGDEMGLVYEGDLSADATPVAITQLARVSNVVTATTAAAHPLFVGQIVRIGPGGTVSSSLVAVATNGIVRSVDGGATWSAAGVTAPAVSFRGLVSTGPVLVAVGEGGIASSADGITWTLRRTGSFRGVCWTGARFIAVGLAGLTAYSTDGLTWTTRLTDAAYDWYAVGWNGSRIVIVGTHAVTVDGEPWQYGASAYSADGTVYSGYRDHTTIARLQGICWTGTRWVAAGFLDVFNGAVRTSSDGSTWATATIPASPALTAICWTGSQAIACGTNALLRSADGSSGWTSAAVTGAWASVAWDGTQTYLGGPDALSTSDASGAVWTPRTAPAGGTYYGAGPAASSLAFAAGEFTVTSTGATSFTYAETGSDGALVAPQTATPVTAAIIDSIPPAFAGASLYTSQSQEGILQSAYEPPGCRDICEFRGSVFWAWTTDRATLPVWLLACGAPSGLQVGDTININGVTYTAGAAEVVATRTFQVYTAGTPSQNVANTASSMVRVVNRAAVSTAYVRDLSGVNEQPGHLQVTARGLDDGIAISTSRPSAFAFTSGDLAVPETHDDEIRWSPNRKPDSAPIVNSKRFGVPVLRTIALRDSVFIFTQGLGVHRLTGDNASWSITPFDTTTELVAPETAVALDNIIFALTSKGFVQVSDTGVTIISKPIEDQVTALLAEPTLSTTRSIAHAAAYESEGRYLAWCPASAAETVPSRAFVYDHYASMASGAPVWTTRHDAASCALVRAADGRLYTSITSALSQERKTLSAADHVEGEGAATLTGAPFGLSVVTVADATGIEAGDGISQGTAFALVESVDGTSVTLDRSWSGAAGAVVVEKAIQVVEQFAPFIMAPGAICRFSELALLMRWIGAGRLDLDLATELTRGAWAALPVEFPVPLPGDVSEGFATIAFHLARDYGLIESDARAVNLRTWVPREQQRGARIMLRLSYRAARSQMALEGVSLAFSPTSVRVRR